MRIKHVVLIALTAACTMGQLCTPPEPYPVDDYPGRLDVNDTLREACSSLDDIDILNLIGTTESDRLLGFSPDSEAAALLSGCPTQECVTCGLAIIDQVYNLEP